MNNINSVKFVLKNKDYKNYILCINGIEKKSYTVSQDVSGLFYIYAKQFHCENETDRINFGATMYSNPNDDKRRCVEIYCQQENIDEQNNV